MGKKYNSKSKKYISLALLTSFCATAPLVLNNNQANAMIGRVGGAVRSATSSIRRSSSTGSIISRTSRSSVSSNATTGSKLPTAKGSGILASNINSRLNDLSNKVENIEISRNLENQRNNHMLNKTIVASGLISSAALVAGVVGGIIQQSKFTQLAQEQAKKDQAVQEDLNLRRKYFQNKEVPEAEQYIIDYYRENYGIDITKK